jgi:hypothetical protein
MKISPYYDSIVARALELLNDPAQFNPTLNCWADIARDWSDT